MKRVVVLHPNAAPLRKTIGVAMMNKDISKILGTSCHNGVGPCGCETWNVHKGQKR